MVSKYDKSKELKDLFIDKDEPVFSTGIVCKLLCIPVWALKQLDDEEIVSPERESKTSTRYYSRNELKLVKHCWYYISEEGVRINGLKIILKMEGYLD